MIAFLSGAVLINLLPLVLFHLYRHQVARWPMPGLWWLGVLALTLVATLLLAGATL